MVVACSCVLHLNAEARVFVELIHFIYHSSVSPSVAESLEDLGRLAALSDRFDVAAAKSFCASEISRNVPDIQSPVQALKVLSICTLLRGFPEANAAFYAAQAFIRKEHGPALLPGAPAKALENFCLLPQVGLEALLESGCLDVPEEDCVLHAGLAWAQANTSLGRDRLTFLAESLLPLIRVPFLSPKALAVLSEEVAVLLRSFEASSNLEEDLTADAASLQGWVAGNMEVYTTGLPQVATCFAAASQLAHCLERMRAAGVQVPANVLKWYQPGTALLQPRSSYRPPDRTLQLCLSYEKCQKIVRPGPLPNVNSPMVGICGRYVLASPSRGICNENHLLGLENLLLAISLPFAHCHVHVSPFSVAEVANPRI